jgi:rhamnosyl/mannosyltransferase
MNTPAELMAYSPEQSGPPENAILGAAPRGDPKPSYRRLRLSGTRSGEAPHGRGATANIDEAQMRAVAASTGTLSVLQLGKYYPPFKGGIESHVQSLCEGLAPRCKLEVLAANTRPQTAREQYRGVRITRVACAGQVLSTPLTPGMVTWLAQHHGHDIIHIHHPNPFAALAYLTGRPPGRLVVSYHSDIVRQRRLLHAYELLQQRLLRHADAILVSSPNYLESSASLRPHRSKCRIIPYGVNSRDYQETPERQHLADRLKRWFGPRVVLAVGRLVGYKGFDVLIAAMKQVDARLVLVGAGPMGDVLRRRAEALGVQDRVFFTGEVKTNYLKACYRACDVFVLPSVARNESFGIVQLEAMASGKPVVSTNVDSGVPYVNKHGHTGTVVPPGDAKALAAAIQHLLDNPSQARALGRNGMERVREEFSHDAMLERIWEVYRELAPGRC